MRAALPPLRLHSVSLYDKDANVLWLSEGALGPDEHNLVLEAIQALTADTSQSAYETGMEDGRIGIFLPVRAPRGDLVGLAMILADLKSVGDGVVEKMVSPQVRTIMQKVAVHLRSTAKTNSSDAPVQVVDSVVDGNTARVAALTMPMPTAEAAAPEPPRNAPGKSAAPNSGGGAAAAAPAGGASNAARGAAAPAASKAPKGKDVLSAQAVDDILEFELTPNVPKAEPAAHPTAETAAAEDAALVSLEIAAEWKPGSAGTASPPPVAAVIPAPVVIETPVLAAAAPVTAAPPVLSAAEASLIPGLELPVLAPSPVAAPPVLGVSAATSDIASTGSATRISQVITVTPEAPKTSSTGTNNALPAPSTTGTARVLTTGTARVLTTGDPGALILEIQPYSKLRSGGRSRRYEVLVRTPQLRDATRDPAALDAHALQRLFSWLSTNRGAWNLEPTSFTLNLSVTTLEDERFPQNVAAALKSHGISPETIGFEIAEPLCTQRRAQVERFITLCDKIGCFVVIDDFSLDSSVLPLLRSKALRLVKIDPKLTNIALKDKLSQAMVVAIAQAVKVLGIHCCAKRVDAQASLQWLTAIGCDFAQGAALAQIQPLDALAQAQA
ncbi:MAG TPA: EAL domain-containing protein [Steroidobacteraceae bacterium]